MDRPLRALICLSLAAWLLTACGPRRTAGDPTAVSSVPMMPVPKKPGGGAMAGPTNYAAPSGVKTGDYRGGLAMKSGE